MEIKPNLRKGMNLVHLVHMSVMANVVGLVHNVKSTWVLVLLWMKYSLPREDTSDLQGDDPGGWQHSALRSIKNQDAGNYRKVKNISDLQAQLRTSISTLKEEDGGSDQEALGWGALSLAVKEYVRDRKIVSS